MRRQHGCPDGARLQRGGLHRHYCNGSLFYGNTSVDRSCRGRSGYGASVSDMSMQRQRGNASGSRCFLDGKHVMRGQFLVYGLDQAWLLAHPQIKDASIGEQYALVHEGGGIISHAHPFREEDYIPEIRLFPEYVDAVEGVNAMHSSRASDCHKNPLFNERALAYGKEHNLPFTAGSDQHTTHMIGGGMVFPRKLKDVHDFTRAVLGRGGGTVGRLQKRVITSGSFPGILWATCLSAGERFWKNRDCCQTPASLRSR